MKKTISLLAFYNEAISSLLNGLLSLLLPILFLGILLTIATFGFGLIYLVIGGAIYLGLIVLLVVLRFLPTFFKIISELISGKKSKKDEILAPQKTRKAFIFAVIIILLIPIAVLTIEILSPSRGAYMPATSARNIEWRREFMHIVARLDNPIFTQVLLGDPERAARHQASLGNFTPIAFDRVGGWSPTIYAAGIDCPKDTVFILYREEDSCFRSEVNDVIAKKFSAYNRTLIGLPTYKGACHYILK